MASPSAARISEMWTDPAPRHLRTSLTPPCPASRIEWGCGGVESRCSPGGVRTTRPPPPLTPRWRAASQHRKAAAYLPLPGHLERLRLRSREQEAVHWLRTQWRRIRARKLGVNTILPCQDQYFVGGQNYNCPYSTTTSESGVDVSTDTWVSFWAAGLLDNREPQQAPQAQESSSDLNFPFPNSCSWEEAQLSSQLYRNKQLQDTLVQKEEELARLHEENNHLRQYLNSALVKCLEEKAKKLLSSDDFSRACGKFRKAKRKPKEQRYFPLETPHRKNAKRNLSSEFANCEEQPAPAVDPWVLQTLGLKDLNTIDDTLSANYSALSPHPKKITRAFPQFLENAVDYGNAPTEDMTIDYGGERTTPSHSTASNREDFHFLSQLSNPLGGLPALPHYTSDVLPNKTEMAFSTSLSPHCNVKTHSFHQGQAFVRRDEKGGWKFTWVPKQS
ncbi:geminin coiled-coil domain-containing protein 1 [Phyllostomus hastatus]|uniref:geminin coiled-coil domain-containing protein 1 n=1 Tax=Phyllostomus hastatus TaxID=9423 RepID=UPI001E683A77|nr:geminin coiled-coil domain-containing protein 1 [Phyllostomus hastatus]